LLGFEHGHVDGVGVVGVEQLAALVFELGESADLEGALVGVALGAGDDLGVEVGGESLDGGVGELDALVELGDFLFEPFGGDVGLAADGRAGGLLAQAVEVQVTALGQLAGQAAPAYAAVQQPFEVVGVLAFAGAAGGT
jgi:hypothetical protein